MADHCERAVRASTGPLNAPHERGGGEGGVDYKDTTHRGMRAQQHVVETAPHVYISEIPLTEQPLSSLRDAEIPEFKAVSRYPSPGQRLTALTLAA